ncbi:MAG: DUF488 domain-containing protein [Lysobacteraceae bacterium]
MPSQLPTTVWTIGHSTRTIDEFIGLLEASHIKAIADVRRFPGSRRYPQFGSEALQATLAEIGIGYRWMPELGGRRRVAPDSPNTVWKNAAFRGYADYMQTTEFATAFDALLAYAAQQRTCLMCAEAVWWRCHRSMISDDLKSRGITVLHIMGEGKMTEHPYTAPARIVDGRLTYAIGDGLFGRG